MINIQPTLIGKLVKIRPLLPQDCQALTLAASDPLIWQQHPQPRRYQRQYFIQRFFEPALACKGALALLNKQDRIIGSSRYYWHRPQHRDIQLGYTFLTRQYWGLSYNRQVKHLMLEHIFQYVDTAMFIVGKCNRRSQLAMGRIGGVLVPEEEIKRRQITCVDSVMFEIRKSNFKGLV